MPMLVFFGQLVLPRHLLTELQNLTTSHLALLLPPGFMDRRAPYLGFAQQRTTPTSKTKASVPCWPPGMSTTRRRCTVRHGMGTWRCDGGPRAEVGAVGADELPKVEDQALIPSVLHDSF